MNLGCISCGFLPDDSAEVVDLYKISGSITSCIIMIVYIIILMSITTTNQLLKLMKLIVSETNYSKEYVLARM